MEFIKGVKEKDLLEIRDVCEGAYEEQDIRMNGSVHTIRDMGDVAFVVLRKRDGLVQCVFEEGVTAFDLKALKRLLAGGGGRLFYTLGPSGEGSRGEFGGPRFL